MCQGHSAGLESPWAQSGTPTGAPVAICWALLRLPHLPNGQRRHPSMLHSLPQLPRDRPAGCWHTAPSASTHSSFSPEGAEPSGQGSQVPAARNLAREHLRRPPALLSCSSHSPRQASEHATSPKQVPQAQQETSPTTKLKRMAQLCWGRYCLQDDPCSTEHCLATQQPQPQYSEPALCRIQLKVTALWPSQPQQLSILGHARQ